MNRFESINMRPPLKKPLQAFFGMDDSPPRSRSNSPPPPAQRPQPQFRTRLGNREVQPLIDSPKPPPLVGLPIPQLDKGLVRDVPQSNITHNIPDIDDEEATPILDSTDSGETFADPVDSFEEEVPEAIKAMEAKSTSNMSLEDPALMPRFSYRASVRGSIRMPSASLAALQDAPRSSFRNSRRLDSSAPLKFLPQSSSFLDFNDDERLTPLEPTEKGDGVWSNMTFDDADSFDTFGSSSPDLTPTEPETTPAKDDDDAPRPDSKESEKPDYPDMTANHRKKDEAEEDGALDVPTAMAGRPGAEGALRDLQRASITAGKELANNLKLMHTKKEDALSARLSTRRSGVSKVQGELLLRSRIFRRWNLRYASIVHQGYYGAVLLLFRPEQKGLAGVMAMKNSKMIALTESSARLVENKRSNGLYLFELRTSQRSYRFGCKSREGRDFWMRHLESPGE